MHTSEVSPLPEVLTRTLPARLLSSVYLSMTRFRNYWYDHVKTGSPVPRTVISVGGIRAGGTGKTPAAIMIARHLHSCQLPVALLSRGYRRKSSRLVVVRPGEQAPWETTGDEPSMFHQEIPDSWMAIGADRLEGARMLSKIVPHNTVYVLDDGFQHRRIRRDMDIVCVHEALFEDRPLPDGYLREPVTSLQRAHAILIIGSMSCPEKAQQAQERIRKEFPGIPVFRMVQKPSVWINGYTGEQAAVPPLPAPVLLCGIARPDRFISMVEQSGIHPSSVRIFKDHHAFTKNDFVKDRNIYSSGVLTTQKDYIRLQAQKVVISQKIWYLKIELQFFDSTEESSFLKMLGKLLPSSS
jgi:tetraacyldisaccharide 4'-kinase